MNWFTLSLFFHLIGVGMIFTLLFAGPIIETNFRWENDISMKRHSAKLLRNIGLLSPFGALVLMLSGIGNMIVLNITFWKFIRKLGMAWNKTRVLHRSACHGNGIKSENGTSAMRALLEQLSQPESTAKISTTK